jgi:hypothetical protein
MPLGISFLVQHTPKLPAGVQTTSTGLCYDLVASQWGYPVKRHTVVAITFIVGLLYSAATAQTPAQDFGSVQSGKVADLILLDANPLENIGNTGRISAVVLKGKLFRRSDLDDLLRKAQQLANQN